MGNPSPKYGLTRGFVNNKKERDNFTNILRAGRHRSEVCGSIHKALGIGKNNLNEYSQSLALIFKEQSKVEEWAPYSIGPPACELETIL